MADRSELPKWVLDALNEHGGEAKIVDVAKYIWSRHKIDLCASGDLFYTWQYDMRWAAKRLRDEGKIASAAQSPRGVWALKKQEESL